MFDFKVYAPGELYGHPNHHAILDCGDGVIYVCMFAFNGSFIVMFEGLKDE